MAQFARDSRRCRRVPRGATCVSRLRNYGTRPMISMRRGSARPRSTARPLTRSDSKPRPCWPRGRPWARSRRHRWRSTCRDAHVMCDGASVSTDRLCEGHKICHRARQMSWHGLAQLNKIDSVYSMADSPIRACTWFRPIVHAHLILLILLAAPVRRTKLTGGLIRG